MTDNSGLLRVVSNSELDAQEALRAEEAAAAREDAAPYQADIINHIRQRWEIMRNHRESAQIDQRLMRSLRVFNGEYDPDTLAAIKSYGGSEVYSRVVGTKARGATALLRDIYFAAKRPWTFSPTPDPVLPEDIASMIPEMVMAEAQQAVAQGMPITEEQVRKRIEDLMQAARVATKDKAKKEAKAAEDKVDDILTEGGFYSALAEILIDIPLFPFTVLKGPMVRMQTDIKYSNGSVQQVTAPKLMWERVSPFDFYWMPGAARIENTDVCQRLRWSRKDLNDLIGLPGWDEDAIRGALRDYDTGLRDWMVSTDAERAIQEDREDPSWNRSGMIDGMEYHGYVIGRQLLEIGFGDDQIDDPDLDYFVEAWLVGTHLLKVQLSPSPRKRHPFSLTSFEKVPGTPLGHSLPDLLSDIGDVANASLRNLVNNMGMASGPQAVVNIDRLHADEDPTSMYPWKRWYVEDDEYNNSSQQRDPISFFQPQSNAGELLGIYQQMTQIADEISAIPRYVTGSGAPGGAGRTASGLAMLMGNASKVLQQVAHNVDTDLIFNSISQLYDLLMVADGGVTLRGDENIVVNGVTNVLAKETERARQLEFLGITANPVDMQITGIEGRAAVLRAVADDLNLPAGEAVPSADEMRIRQEQAVQAAAANAEAEAAGDGNPGEKPGGGETPVTNTVQPTFNQRGN